MKKYSRRDFLKSTTVFLSCLFMSRRCFWASAGENFQSAGQQSDFSPAYIALQKKGELKRRGEALWATMETCRLCPRECGANRLAGQKGFCHASAQLEISSAGPHTGEEPPLVGSAGSGTIFFTNCSLLCVFCVNAGISHEGKGQEVTIDDLAGMMISLQKRNCHNINLVTPSHYLPHILLALDKAVLKGLKVPVVYNSSGWERIEMLKMLEGVVDIYLPDFKYIKPEMASLYSAGAHTYPEITKQALLEMHRQVGIATPARNGLMQRGLMIRHLVMPNDVSSSCEVMAWIGENLPEQSYVNIMSQYAPHYKAKDFSAINRRITREEYQAVLQAARAAGLLNLEVQGSEWMYHQGI
ncbi:MAG: radical SAM protein [Candidatus Omnitrophica bacterium]|nr:radical SAM protein [Candidatus Omnitrophota bacterium]